MAPEDLYGAHFKKSERIKQRYRLCICSKSTFFNRLLNFIKLYVAFIL